MIICPESMDTDTATTRSQTQQVSRKDYRCPPNKSPNRRDLVENHTWTPPPLTWKSLVLLFLGPHTFLFPLFGAIILASLWIVAGYLPVWTENVPTTRIQAWGKSLGVSVVVVETMFGIEWAYMLAMLIRTSLIGGIIWYIFDMIYGRSKHTGERTSLSFIEMWKICHGYFPASLFLWDGERYTDKTEKAHNQVYDVDKRPFIFALHPHGPIPLGISLFMPLLSRWPKILKKTKMAVASAAFNMPFMRDFYLWFGAVDAARTTLSYQLQQGNSITLLPGGIKEQLLVCSPNSETVVLKNRKGFIRLGLQHGASLVPVFVFGERAAYRASRLLAGISWFIKRLCNAGVPLVRGRYFTMVALPGPVKLVAAEPIHLPRLNIVRKEEEKEDFPLDLSAVDFTKPQTIEVSEAAFEKYVDHFHAAYTETLRYLFEEHKEAAGFGQTQLKIL